MTKKNKIQNANRNGKALFVRIPVIVFNSVIIVVMLVLFISNIEDFQLGDFRPVWFIFLSFPVLNILSHIVKTHLLIQLMMSLSAFACNFVILLIMLLRLVWPLGHIGSGWELVFFWFIFGTIIISEIVLPVRFIYLLRQDTAR